MTSHTEHSTTISAAALLRVAALEPIVAAACALRDAETDRAAYKPLGLPTWQAAERRLYDLVDALRAEERAGKERGEAEDVD